MSTAIKASAKSNHSATLGASARRLRIARLLTQKKLADLAGVSREQVASLELNYPVTMDIRRRIFRELWAAAARK